MLIRHLLCLRSFNSIKVRLNLKGLTNIETSLGSFTSINLRLTHATGGDYSGTPSFQFHKGTIKPGRPFHAESENSSFNSIKVRLNHREDFYQPELDNLFQFHKGTIKPPVRRSTVGRSSVSIP